MRVIYASFLRLHPRWFRARFEEEMLYGFDRTTRVPEKVWLMWDVVFSLLRQWILRPDHPIPAPVSAIPLPDGIPRFATIGDPRPRVGALFAGGVASIALFAAIALAALQEVAHVRLGWRPEGFPHSFTSMGRWPATGLEGTPAMRRFSQWMYVYNNSDIEAMRDFASGHLAEQANDPGAVERTVQQWVEHYRRLGKLRPQVHIETLELYRIVVNAETSGGKWERITAEVTDEPPHAITNLHFKLLE
jgi:hypothetical protein